jgi:hypothetical protein
MYLSWWQQHDPFLVSSEVTDATVRKLKNEGSRIGIDIILKKQNKLSVNALLFKEYISTQ